MQNILKNYIKGPGPHKIGRSWNILTKLTKY